MEHRMVYPFLSRFFISVKILDGCTYPVKSQRSLLFGRNNKFNQNTSAYSQDRYCTSFYLQDWAKDTRQQQKTCLRRNTNEEDQSVIALTPGRRPCCSSS
jgi:hypothetical protein